MINHMRTLLLNRPASRFNDVAYAEYIPEDFHPLALDTALQSVKDILVPRGLDAAAENYLATMLMHILHMPELDSYTRQPDSRTTYTENAEVLSRAVDSPLTIAVNKSGTCDMTLQYRVNGAGYPQNMATAGNHVWMLRSDSARKLRVQYSRGDSELIDVIDPNLSGRSKDIVLLPGYIRVYFQLPSNLLTGIFTYRLETTIAVPYDIATSSTELDRLLAQARVNERVFRPVGTYASTIAELHHAYTNTLEIGLKFGTVVLSYLYQLDMLYTGVTNG